MKLAASMLVRNEVPRYLQAVIGSLRDYCDLIAVLDDGSTDNTGAWLDDNADEKMVVRHLDPGDGFFAGHEGRRRQALLDFTLEQEPTHVLAIDADEFVADGQAVRRFCEAGGNAVGTLVMEEVWGFSESELRVRCDGGWKPHPVPILWQVPEKLSSGWRIQDRALACGREPLAVRDLFRHAQPVGTEVLHFGWSNVEERAERHQRYVEADRGRFHNRRHLDSIIWDDSRVAQTVRGWPAGLRVKNGRVEYEGQ